MCACVRACVRACSQRLSQTNTGRLPRRPSSHKPGFAHQATLWTDAVSGHPPDNVSPCPRPELPSPRLKHRPARHRGHSTRPSSPQTLTRRTREGRTTLVIVTSNTGPTDRVVRRRSSAAAVLDDCSSFPLAVLFRVALDPSLGGGRLCLDFPRTVKAKDKRNLTSRLALAHTVSALV